MKTKSKSHIYTHFVNSENCKHLLKDSSKDSKILPFILLFKVGICNVDKLEEATLGILLSFLWFDLVIRCFRPQAISKCLFQNQTFDWCFY